MLRLDFANREFYFCEHCAAFTRVAILSARGAARLWRAKFYELARRRGFLRFTEYDFTDWQRERGFTSRTIADSGLSAALARCHPILEHIKRFEILLIKS